MLLEVQGQSVFLKLGTCQNAEMFLIGAFLDNDFLVGSIIGVLSFFKISVDTKSATLPSPTHRLNHIINSIDRKTELELIKWICLNLVLKS